jgi:predicted aspartyl protease
MILNDENEVILETEKILNIFKTERKGKKRYKDLVDGNAKSETKITYNIASDNKITEHRISENKITEYPTSELLANDHGSVYFNTPNHIYKVNHKISNLKLENIILSSYKEDKAIFYLNNRKLVLVNLENMKILLERTVNYEISTLLLSDFILISTFDNKFLCLNEEDFHTKNIIKAPTFIHSLNFKNRSFFSNGKEVFEYKTNNSFDKIYESYTPITSLCPIKSSILIISKESVLINLKDLSKSKIKLQDITNAFYDEYYHFSKGKKLITCDFENGTSYNCFLFKNLSIKHSEIVGYFPGKNLIVSTDKLTKSTTILLNDKEVRKIQDFFTNNVIELENELILSGFTNENQIVISISTKSLDVNPMILHKESNEILNVYNFKEGFIITNSNTLFFYNNRLIKIYEFEIDFTIHKIHTNSNYILILDYFRSFVLFKNIEENVFENLGSPSTSNCKFDTGILTDKHIILSSGSILFVYEIEGFKMVLQTNLGSDIIYIGTKSLDINYPKDIYIFTFNFVIYSLKRLLKN